MGMEEQVIRITDPSKKVVQMNCVRCHEHVNDRVHTKMTLAQVKHGEGKFCWECHREVPHGRINSLSSVPNAKIQNETPLIPAWLKTRPKNTNPEGTP
jgi:cytochrome c nitrite reductase small subunit